jgi:hypothetical protein
VSPTVNPVLFQLSVTPVPVVSADVLFETSTGKGELGLVGVELTPRNRSTNLISVAALGFFCI